MNEEGKWDETSGKKETLFQSNFFTENKKRLKEKNNNTSNLGLSV